jgi:nucleotide-binding universal stress UspA family protein
MKWIVGLDLRPHSHGALAFAAWLSANARDQSFVGLHVVEERDLPVSGSAAIDPIVRAARDHTLATLRATHTTDALGEPEVVPSRTADAALAAALSNEAADGIIIGRRAAAGEHSIVRLGRVARRLLRHLPGPVLVAPADLSPDHMGDGPVLAALDGTDSSLGAARIAARMAESLGRELVLVHAVGLSSTMGVDYLPPDTAHRIRQTFESDERPRLEAWIAEHGLQDARLKIVEGPVVQSLLVVAERESACMVATGSRGLGPIEHLFVTGVGLDLAGAAPLPVLIAPGEVAK